MKLAEWLHTKAAQRASYGILLGSMLLVILGYPILAELGFEQTKLLSILLLVVLLGCLAAAVDRTRILALFIGAVILVEVVASTFDLGGEGASSILQHSARSVVLFLTALVLLRAVMRSPIVNTDTILGAVSVYLLLGLTGAELYALIFLVDPQAIAIPAHLSGADLGPREIQSVASYYSFVTITTLGYGDVTPVSAVARSVASMQAVAGQLYIAVIVARLVALQVSNAALNRSHERPGRRGSDPGAPPRD